MRRRACGPADATIIVLPGAPATLLLPLWRWWCCCRCIEVMNRHAKERVAFGKPIASYGQIQRHIAESYAEYAAGEEWWSWWCRRPSARTCSPRF